MKTVDFSKLQVQHPPCWVKEFAHVARIVGTVEKGRPGAAAWVEVSDGKRWTYLEHQTAGLSGVSGLRPLSDLELRRRGVPQGSFPDGYDIATQHERDFWRNDEILKGYLKNAKAVERIAAGGARSRTRPLRARRHRSRRRWATRGR